MRMIVIPQASQPEFVDVGFDDVRNIVGGTLGASRLTEDLILYYHDEGLLVGLPPNLETTSGMLLCGTLFVARIDPLGEEDVACTTEDLSTVRKFVAESKRLGHIKWDVPGPVFATSFEELEALGSLPAPRMISIDGKAIVAKETARA